MGDQTFPDLDLMPDCSICDGPLEYDEGFGCGRCEVYWPRSGEGSEASSYRRDACLCEARCPSDADVLHDGMFCEDELGHPGDHVIPARDRLGESPKREIRWPQSEEEAAAIQASLLDDNDEAMRRAGFRGYEGCPDADCPMPYQCSEAGTCLRESAGAISAPSEEDEADA